MNMVTEKNKEIDNFWDSHWKEYLTNSDGSIDLIKLKAELYDYGNLKDRMSTLTHELTNGILSYPNYPVSTILAVHEECQEKELQAMLEDGICPTCNTNSDCNPTISLE